MAQQSPGSAPIDRVPPQDLDAERGVIGCILLANDSLDEVTQNLSAEQFYLDAHQKIFGTMVELRNNQVNSIDAVILANALAKRGVLAAIGGIDYLEQLLNCVPHAGRVKYYADIVRDKWLLRRMIGTATEILRASYEESEDTAALLEKAEQSIFKIGQQKETGARLELRDILLRTFSRINDRIARGGAISGHTTGFRDLDTKINGLQASELVILAARPSMGKTAFVVNVAEAVAEISEAAVVLFSLEMSAEELAERFLCVRARLQVHKIRKGDLTEDEKELLADTAAELNNLPIYIDDQPGRNMSQINAICRRLARDQRHKLGLVVIDYLQLIEPEDKRAPREQQIAGITRRLKFLAKELQVPVLALAQLNRGVELRDDKRPRLADLRESGAIEQDADIVTFLHRPEMYDSEDRPGEAEIVVAKNRNGPTGIVTLAFSRESMRFQDYSPLDADSGSSPFLDRPDEGFNAF